MAQLLPDGYRSRPATVDDAEAVSALISACEREYGYGTLTTPTDVRDDWHGVDMEDETIIVEDAGGRVVASADLVNRQYAVISVYGYVPPEHEGKGLGRFLVEWGERWAVDRMGQARPDVQIVVRHFIHAKNEAALQLLADCGYEQVRHTYVMAIKMEDPPPAPDWPDGIVQTEFRPGVDERAAHEAVEDAFRDTWGRPPSPYERFLEFSRGEGVKPDLWILARDSDEEGEVAGVFLGTLTSDQGWVPTVGVRRAWRRKGLGLALLQAGFNAYYRRGITDVRLSVDGLSLTGATRLYERAGMHVVSNFLLHEKVLRDGIDLGVSSSDSG